jgi:hypothetical protein
MLSYASGRRHAFIDRALYLPRRWTDDPQRCAQAGVPAEGGLATKPSTWIDIGPGAGRQGAVPVLHRRRRLRSRSGAARGATPPRWPT